MGFRVYSRAQSTFDLVRTWNLEHTEENSEGWVPIITLLYTLIHGLMSEYQKLIPNVIPSQKNHINIGPFLSRYGCVCRNFEHVKTNKKVLTWICHRWVCNSCSKWTLSASVHILVFLWIGRVSLVTPLGSPHIQAVSKMRWSNASCASSICWYPRYFMCSHTYKSRVVKFGDQGGQRHGLQRPISWPGKWWSKYVFTAWWK
jgi:hypothetical protein